MKSTGITNFDSLVNNEQSNVLAVSNNHKGEIGFFLQEVLRFISIAGTLTNTNFKLDLTATVDERYITHILIRSLIENYVRVLYLFDDPAQTHSRLDELRDGFKRDYAKMYNEIDATFRQSLDQPQSGWSALPRSPDVNTMLVQVKNPLGQRMGYQYFTYRVTSFDTHGNNLGAIFNDVFGKPATFPVLKINQVIDEIAGFYLAQIAHLRSHSVIP